MNCDRARRKSVLARRRPKRRAARRRWQSRSLKAGRAGKGSYGAWEGDAKSEGSPRALQLANSELRSSTSRRDGVSKLLCAWERLRICRAKESAPVESSYTPVLQQRPPPSSVTFSSRSLALPPSCASCVLRNPAESSVKWQEAHLLTTARFSRFPSFTEASARILKSNSGRCSSLRGATSDSTDFRIVSCIPLRLASAEAKRREEQAMRRRGSLAEAAREG